jgi:hypothetical protein
MISKITRSRLILLVNGSSNAGSSSVDDLPSLVKRIKAQDKKIELRKRQLEIQTKRKAPVYEAPVVLVEAGPSDSLVNPPSAGQSITNNAKQNPNSSGNVVQKSQTPGIHPLPPKPGTSTSSVSKAPIIPSAPEKAEAPRPKKVVQPVVPHDPQLETFEAVRLDVYFSLLNTDCLVGEAQVVMACLTIGTGGPLATLFCRQRQSRKDDVDGGTK